MMMMMMMMMMNDDEFFFGMVDRQKAFSRISNWNHSQRYSPWRIFDTPRAGFEPVQNLSSGLVEWSYPVVITTTPQRLAAINWGVPICSVLGQPGQKLGNLGSMGNLRNFFPTFWFDLILKIEIWEEENSGKKFRGFQGFWRFRHLWTFDLSLSRFLNQVYQFRF